MKRKILLSLTTITLFLFTACGSSSSVTVVGAATDDYIINGKVQFYKTDGTKLDTNCTSGDFGLFSCNLNNINTDETILIVVSDGKIDQDGNATTTEDQKAFEGSLAALSSADKAIIVSPMTSKIITDTLGEKLIVDNDQNLSYINGVFIPNEAEISLLKQNSQKMLNTLQALPLTHLLQTHDQRLIQEQVQSVTKILDQNISILNTINPTKDNFHLQILHINDTHSHLEPTMISLYLDGVKTYLYAGGYAKIAAFIKDKKTIENHTVALHAGDSVQGTLYYTLFDGVADIETLNLMHLDAMTIGNHEFDKGATDFSKYFASKANFPIVSDDIEVLNDPTLQAIIKPYIIKDIDGQKVAIVGDSIDASVISNPGPTIAFLNYLTSAQQSVDELKEQNINKIIFLTHLGYKTDQILAQSVKDIDIIVGGHSHTLLGNFSNLGLTSQGNYPTVVQNSDAKTLIVSAWQWGEVIGDLNVVFDKEGHINNYTGDAVMLVDDTFLRKDNAGNKLIVDKETKGEIEKQLASMANIKIQSSDSAVTAVIEQYKPQIDELMTTTIAAAETTLIHVRLPGSTDPQSGEVLANGSMIAPHVALAMYEKAKATGGCDFALQNAGALRISIPQGNISIGEVYTLLPFGNTLVTLKMDGKTILSMLEDAIERSLIQQTNTGAFPYFAGAKLTIDPNKPKNSRIVDFQLKNQNGEWSAFDSSKKYTIATNSYVAGGGDYYSQMCEATDKIDTGFVIAEMFVEYAKTKKILDKLPNEIQIVTLTTNIK